MTQLVVLIVAVLIFAASQIKSAAKTILNEAKIKASKFEAKQGGTD